MKKISWETPQKYHLPRFSFSLLNVGILHFPKIFSSCIGAIHYYKSKECCRIHVDALVCVFPRKFVFVLDRSSSPWPKPTLLVVVLHAVLVPTLIQNSNKIIKKRIQRYNWWTYLDKKQDFSYPLGTERNGQKCDLQLFFENVVPKFTKSKKFETCKCLRGKVNQPNSST